MTDEPKQLPDALQHVQDLCRRLADGDDKEGDRGAARLRAIVLQMDGFRGKTLLKSKFLAPFVQSVVEAGGQLEELSEESAGPKGEGAHAAEWSEAVERLENEVAILAVKLANRDIVIT